MSGPDWPAALRHQLAPLLDSLGRGDGAPPALRYRVEGFARAICSLGLATPEEVIGCVRAAYAEALGPSASDYVEEDFCSVEAGAPWPRVPVRLPRAPVHVGSTP